ncbi:MAG: class I SAM-dependent methyltransferase [Parvularculaceae bacterium]
MRTLLMLSVAALTIAACAKKAEEPAAPAAIDAPVEQQEPIAAPTPAAALEAVLATLPDTEKARFQYRHPTETLQFFGVEPGMTVVEVLPGAVWWSQVLLPYLGPTGKLIGADYSLPMWVLFGEYAPDVENTRKNWAADWTARAGASCAASCAPVSAFVYGSLPEDMKGTADAVLMFRAVHHFARLEDNGGFYTAALKDTLEILKPGGIVGVEAHRAPAGNSDAWADGENGYLKQDAVIAAFTAAGFEFVAASEINANPKDQPTDKDFVWRLPPTLATSADNPELKAQMEAIGESDRMTLKFRKPA